MPSGGHALGCHIYIRDVARAVDDSSPGLSGAAVVAAVLHVRVICMTPLTRRVSHARESSGLCHRICLQNRICLQIQDLKTQILQIRA